MKKMEKRAMKLKLSVETLQRLSSYVEPDGKQITDQCSYPLLCG